MECWNCKGVYKEEAAACPWCGAPKQKTSPPAQAPDLHPPNQESKKGPRASRILLLLTLFVVGIFVLPGETQRQILRWLLSNEKAQIGLGLLSPLPKITSTRCQQAMDVNSGYANGLYYIRASADVKNDGKSGRIRIFFDIEGNTTSKIVRIASGENEIVEAVLTTKSKRPICRFRTVILN